MKRFRIQLVIAFIVLVCGVSLMGLVYIVFNKPYVPINPGITVSAPSPVATPVSPIVRPRGFTRVAHHPSYAAPSYSPMQNAIGYTTSSRGLYMTSNARVHSVGGGGNYGITTTSSSSSAARGIRVNSATVAMPQTNFMAMASSRQMALPAATEAPQMAKLASNPRHAPSPPTITNPPEDNQLVEHPIGDALWPMAMMAIAYAITGLIRRKRKA